ncbi:unnamed protein product [Arabidopsis arenosa]|uniref:Uncharacterized protein n=1 Tax=Arabidopsis arenosa TaxID=38785 RepID=A0A8S2B2Y7_ARAAE|nr:unnamed protein product [Arabidopsis arenosa]
MRGVLNYHKFYTFLVVCFVVTQIHPTYSIYVNTLPSTEILTISSNRTIVSPGDVFELGFFKLGSPARWYLGIWYKKVPEISYVWVANRDNPLSNSMGGLKIVDGNLIIFDHYDNYVWSTNLTTKDVRSSLVAELLDNGNFVLRVSNNNDPDKFLWQSFDYPTDTLLPQMKLGWDLKTGLNRFLRSWKSSDDPSSGNFTCKLETRGFPEFLIRFRFTPIYRSGPWDGIRFSGMPEMRDLDYMFNKFTANGEEVAYTFLMTNKSIYSRITLSSAGIFERYTWVPTSWEWTLFSSSPTDQCDMNEECGPYSYCDTSTSPVCNCIQGFSPKSQQQWDLADGLSGCVRRTPLSCRGDRFLRLKNMKLPDTMSAIVDMEIDEKDCKKRCLWNCNCTGFANADIRNGGSGCVIWTGELLDIRSYVANGQDFHVRLAASEIGDEKKISKTIIGLIVGVCVMLLLSSIIFYFWNRRKKRANATPIVFEERNQDLVMNGVVISNRRHLSAETETEDLELPLMEFEAVVMATDNFSSSNKLGQGGFGIVYKVWRNWKEGKGLEVVDPIIKDSSSSTFRPHEILRCIQIGLLCVQEYAEDRPMMSSVVLMLGSETVEIPQPKPPGYCVGRSKQYNDESCSLNQITLSIVEPR